MYLTPTDLLELGDGHALAVVSQDAGWSAMPGHSHLQQVLREIVYAGRHLPRWMYVPDAALPALLKEIPWTPTSSPQISPASPRCSPRARTLSRRATQV